MDIAEIFSKIRDLGYDVNIVVTKDGFNLSATMTEDGWYREFAVSDTNLLNGLTKLYSILD